MRKRGLRYPSELNTWTVRISRGTYALLKELATKNRLTIAEALDLLVTDRAPKETIAVSRSQIPMSPFVARPMPVLSVNGDKHTGLAVRPKGGIIQ